MGFLAKWSTEDYETVHNGRPSGIRRWRFVATSLEDQAAVLQIEADGEYAFVVTPVMQLANEQLGDCTIVVMATSGPPRESGEPLERAPGEGVLRDWSPGQIRAW